MTLRTDSTYNLDKIGGFAKINFVSQPYDPIYLYISNLKFLKESDTIFSFITNNSKIVALDYTKCLNFAGVDIETFLDNYVATLVISGTGGGVTNDVNLTEINGVAVSTSAGPATSGTLRITLATDDPLRTDIQNIGTTVSSSYTESIDQGLSLDSIDTKLTTTNTELADLNTELATINPVLDDIEVNTSNTFTQLQNIGVTEDLIYTELLDQGAVIDSVNVKLTTTNNLLTSIDTETDNQGLTLDAIETELLDQGTTLDSIDTNIANLGTTTSSMYTQQTSQGVTINQINNKLTTTNNLLNTIDINTEDNKTRLTNIRDEQLEQGITLDNIESNTAATVSNTATLGTTVSNSAIYEQRQMITQGDLGLVRYLIDRGEPGFENYRLQSIIMDGSQNTFSNSPATATERTGGMPLSSPFPRVTFPPLGAGQVLYIASTLTTDTAAGTGARTIYIEGLDSNWDLVTDTITMNGQVGVATNVTNFIRVNKMFVSSAGSLNTNDGAIYVTTVNDFSAGIPQTNVVHAIQRRYGYATMGITSVQRNERLYFTRGSYYTDASNSRPLKNTQYSTYPWDPDNPNTNRITLITGTLWSSNTTAFNTSGSAPEFPCTDVEFTVQTQSGGSSINYSIFWNTIRIIDNAF